MSNRLFTDDTGKDILDAIKQQNAIMVKGSNGLKVESYEDVLSIVRMGLAPAVFRVGDIIEVGRETALVASMGAHTGITAAGFIATTGEDTFLAAMDEAGEKEYEIIFDGSAWKYGNAPIILADYGLSVTGTPAEGDTIIVVETASTINMVVMDFIENGQTTIGNIKLHDKTKEYGMILQSEKILYALQHDAPEAFYVVPEGGLTAGTYHVTLGDNYDTAYGGGATYQFTLTQAVPAGGQISLDWPYQKTPLQGSGVKTWESGAATTPIETVAPTAGSGGSDLGTLLVAAQPTLGLNSIHRMRYGSNRWSTSAMRQHLNSGKAAGSVWAPQNPWDRAPSWVSSTAGFMHGLDPEFIKVCADVDLLTARSTVAGDCTAAEGSAGTGFETTKDKFFLPSRPEVFGGGDNASDKGDPWEYYKANSDVPGGASNSGNDSNRIKVNASNGNAAYWWMRSPYVGFGGNVRYIYTSGNVHYSIATSSHGVAPACVVA